jgi:hypothetical protein
LSRMPNTKIANGSSRLAIQRPVRTACDLLFRSLELIISGLRRFWLRWSHVDCSMAGMEPQRRATNVWTGLFDRLVTRWRFALGRRPGLGVEPVEAIVGDVSTTPDALAARSEAASQLPPTQVYSFHRPVLVLNPRSGSARAVREQLLEAAGRYGIQLDEAATPPGSSRLLRG